MGELTPEDRLTELGIYQLGQQEDLRSRFQALAARSFTFGLCHGDLDLRNLILSEDHPPALIDWGCAEIGPVPFFDFIQVVRHHFDDDVPDRAGLQAFADGLGFDLEAEFGTLMDVNLLKSIDLVRWALDRAPEHVDRMVANARACVARTLSA